MSGYVGRIRGHIVPRAELPAIMPKRIACNKGQISVKTAAIFLIVVASCFENDSIKHKNGMKLGRCKGVVLSKNWFDFVSGGAFQIPASMRISAPGKVSLLAPL